jgi:hypothetical protein
MCQDYFLLQYIFNFTIGDKRIKELKDEFLIFCESLLISSTYLFSVNFYDEKGRVIQVQVQNITATTAADIVTTQYNWSGQPLVTVQKQEKGGTSAQTSIVVTQMTYDDLGRVTQTDKKYRIPM